MSFTVKEQIKELSRLYTDTLRKHRRYLHENPELSFHEYNTRGYILSVLDTLGIPYRTFPDRCAVVARIRGHHSGECIAFRGDMDALALHEQHSEIECPYRSKNEGVMHACGHDGHTAVLLTLAEVLSRHTDCFSGEVVLIFQDGEETIPGGATYLIENGVLDGVSRIYGAHLWPSYDTGTVGFSPKELMSSADMFQLTYTGNGGHGSQPHLTQDVVLAGCGAVEQFQSIVSRQIDALDAAVVSVCTFQSGTAFNVIPDQTEISGTVRTFSKAIQNKIIHQLEHISQHMAEIYGISYDFRYSMGYPPVINHPEVVDKACRRLTELTDLHLVQSRPVMQAEDFAYYLEQIPGSFFFVGCHEPGTNKNCALHSSCYFMDENALNVGLELFLALIFD